MSSGLIRDAFAESDRFESRQRNLPRVSNIAPAHSCYTHLTMMVRGSSLKVADRVRPSLRLTVERDDGDNVLMAVYGGNGGGNGQQEARFTSQIGWLAYQPQAHRLKDVSDFVENEGGESAFVNGDEGRILRIDRRHAYLFDECRQRRDVARQVSCRNASQQNQADAVFARVGGQGRVARLNKESGEKVTLYSAADISCRISDNIVLKPGAALKIYQDKGDFYFVRQDDFKRDFITGWILKDHVQNVKFLVPPASAQPSGIDITPSPKPVDPKLVASRPTSSPKPVEVAAENIARPQAKPATPMVSEKRVEAQPQKSSQPLEPDFDVEMPQATSVVVAEEMHIPIPIMTKPSPSQLEERPVHRPRRGIRRNDGGGREG